MENRELSMCEKAKTRKCTSLKPISVKTLKNHMFALEEAVQEQQRSRCYRNSCNHVGYCPKKLKVPALAEFVIVIDCFDDTAEAAILVGAFVVTSFANAMITRRMVRNRIKVHMYMIAKEEARRCA
ncbi:hypothetical protein PHYPSEUDO_014672 [Phytophthora pseudosyringae]|uniref:Uncharacterized protein n=1 Tax=Phytophthora pseudosyringae TaxID=221518 RepID=A0A8T1W072_9STRA|nr:hypothetical protein PHYPSEUDO_014672 [Phytophthora pseudosyringae]